MNDPTPADLEAALDVARQTARAAGDLIRAQWDRGVTVRHKGDVDLVTETDLAAEALIVACLRAAFPEDALVAEEGGGHAASSGRTWYVDPLDGTTNFAHGFPHFAVSIALADMHGPCVGVVHAPLTGWTFAARRGGGATLDDRLLRVTECPLLDAALLATGFPYDRRTNPDNNVDRFATLLRRCQGIRRAGSAALDLAFVAAGWLDGYWEGRLQPWDIAAGCLLVTEAGGSLTDFDGVPIGVGPADAVLRSAVGRQAGGVLRSDGLRAPALRQSDFRRGAVVASNGRVHVELLRALAAARGSAPES